MFDLEKNQDEIAFYDDSNHYVLYRDIYRISQEIKEIIGSRNLVYLLCDNTIGSLVYYVAFLVTDNVVQLEQSNSKPSWIKKHCSAFQPSYVCVPNDYNYNLLVVHSCFDYCILKSRFDRKYDINPDLSILLATSGSTGECKFVRQSKKNILANTQAIIKYMKLSKKDKPILSLPLAYSYGLSVVNTHFFLGATILLSKKKFFQREYWDFFNQQQGTSISGVPSTYELLYQLGFMNMDLPYLNCMTQAGGKLSNELIQKYNIFARQKNVQFFIMYGQTEATARMTYLPYQYAWKNEKIGSVGIAIPGTEIYLEDDTGKRITSINEVGEIIFEGDNVTMGYAMSCEDLNMGDDNHGSLKTGDIGYFDNDRYLFISGRKKRFVKICGKRYNLDSIELYLIDKYGLEIDCAVIGNDKKIYVIIDNEKMCCSIENYLYEYYHLHRSHLMVIYLSNIPKTLSGKKNYEEIKKI